MQQFSGSHLGIIWESLGNHLGVIWETLGSHLGIIWELLGSHLGIIWELSRGLCQVVPKPCWEVGGWMMIDVGYQDDLTWWGGECYVVASWGLVGSVMILSGFYR